MSLFLERSSVVMDTPSNPMDCTGSKIGPHGILNCSCGVPKKNKSNEWSRLLGSVTHTHHIWEEMGRTWKSLPCRIFSTGVAPVPYRWGRSCPLLQTYWHRASPHLFLGLTVHWLNKELPRRIAVLYDECSPANSCRPLILSHFQLCLM